MSNQKNVVTSGQSALITCAMCPNGAASDGERERESEPKADDDDDDDHDDGYPRGRHLAI